MLTYKHATAMILGSFYLSSVFLLSLLNCVQKYFILDFQAQT